MPQAVWYLGSITLQSLCIMAMAGMVSMCLRNVATRHAIWAVALGSILLLPIADALLPVTTLPAPIPQITLQPSFTVMPQVSKPAVMRTLSAPPEQRAFRWTGFAWSQLFIAVYAGVALLLLLRMGIAHHRVRHLKQTSRRIETPAFDDMLRSIDLRRRVPQLAESLLIRVPLTVGFLKPVVLLPQGWISWRDWDLRAVLAHELAHVRRADWAITVLAGLNCCLFWFNPFLWWLERHLSALAEQASDEASLSLIEDAPRYAEVLLGFASEAQDGHRFIGGVAMARRNIRARIDRILTLRRPHSGIIKRAGWFAIIAVAMPVLYVVAAVQSPPPPRPATPSPARARVQEPPASPLPRQTEPAEKATEPSRAAPAIEHQKFENEIRDFEEAVQSAQKQLSNSWTNPNVEWHTGLAKQKPNWLGGYIDLLNPTFKDGLPPNITLPTNSFAFYLTSAGDGTVSFRRAEGTAWNSLSYGCQTCSFFVNETGVGPENLSGPGILLKMEESASASPQTPLPDAAKWLEPLQTHGLTMTCRARECWATEISSWGKQPSARFKFDQAKFDMTEPNFSQILIIVGR
jgi:beta-lactamase regulating signal transducer with metallopeptidase domain